MNGTAALLVEPAPAPAAAPLPPAVVEDVRPGRASAYPRPVEKTRNRTTEEWLSALSGDGVERERAVADLHDLLLRAARFEVGRRQAALSHVRGEELDDLATQAADDALMAVLRKLDQFRGASRFTTWAYKFALLEAGVRLRRRAWQGREVVLSAEGWTGFVDDSGSVQKTLEQSELLGGLRDAIETALTPHQRRVFVALALNEVPIDVLSERLGSSRGALYKTLHDARRALRSELASAGLLQFEEQVEAKP